MDSQQFCLRWDSYARSVTSVFEALRKDKSFVDVTLCCEGIQIQAHRMILSACSPYFCELLKNNSSHHMAIFLKDTSVADLTAIVEFMYCGSVSVRQNQLGSFIRTAEMLQIRGLSNEDEKSADGTGVRRRQCSPPPPPPQLTKRPRTAELDPPQHVPTPPVLSCGRQLADTDARPASGRHPVTMATADVSAYTPLPPSCAAPPSTTSSTARDEIAVKVEEADVHGSAAEESSSMEFITRKYMGEQSCSENYTADEETAAFEEQLTSPAAPTADQEPVGGQMLSMPSHTLPGMALLSADDSTASGGSSQSTRNVCDICGSSYKHRESLYHHRKKHEGLTTCPICQKVCSIVADLRRHMEVAHQLSAEQVRKIIPTKPKERMGWGEKLALFGVN